MSARHRVEAFKLDDGKWGWEFTAGAAKIRAAKQFASETEAIQAGVRYRNAFDKMVEVAMRKGCQEASMVR